MVRKLYCNGEDKNVKLLVFILFAAICQMKIVHFSPVCAVYTVQVCLYL